jgi:hypothetical protein
VISRGLTLFTPRALFDELCGEQLSAVTFVQDYLQLWFDGRGINVTNPLTVVSSSEKVTTGQPGFRDALCAQIAKIVDKVEIRASESLVLMFGDGSLISISLRPEDYSSAEAFYASGFANHQWITG